MACQFVEVPRTLRLQQGRGKDPLFDLGEQSVEEPALTNHSYNYTMFSYEASGQSVDGAHPAGLIGGDGRFVSLDVA